MHTTKSLVRGAPLVAGVAVVLAWLSTSGAAQPGKFDKLSDADRKAFGERFEKEIWPLLARNGKDGCVGCHNDKKQVTALRMSGDALQDFGKMVGEGFFIKGDAGSLLERIKDKDPKRHMPPPPKRPSWTDAEIRLLEAFVDDLDKKNR
jgi:hypothetical protein